VKLNFFNMQNNARRPADRLRLYDQVAGVGSVSQDYRTYGYDYFDNPDLAGLGYGGYRYDGRFADPVGRLCRHYDLQTGDRILEIGCAKGYVLVEFLKRGLPVTGIDISRYAIANVHPLVRSHVTVGDAGSLPFPDNTFDFVIAKEILPHLPESAVAGAIREAVRVSRNNLFFEIQTGHSATELERVGKWDRTHQCVRPPAWWEAQLAAAGYPGDVYFKILLPDG
jgi:SAM-dependent methyltransferase